MFDYFSEHQTRPHHFLYPMFMTIIGGIFAHIKTWEWVGYMIWAFAVICAIWLFYTTYKKHQIDEIREHYQHDAEITKLDASRTTTKVVIDKTPLMGTPYQNFTEVNIPPGKLKKFAHGVLNEGKPMTIREWTPLKKGKLFSDPQWRRLIEFMKHPDWEDRRTRFIVPINPNNDQDGFELTAAGTKWLQDILNDATVLTPH
jgi:Ca2+/Na+ antiporter